MQQNPLTKHLIDFISYPTIATTGSFLQMADRTGWQASQQATFDMASDYLETWLTSFADNVQTQDVKVGAITAKNIWAVIHGETSQNAILLQGHYDVVEADGTYQAYIEDGKLYGRGATDMKGAVVAGIRAVERIIEAGKRPKQDTYILITCEEEVSARGANGFADNPPQWVNDIALAICMESTYGENSINLANEHPGVACVHITAPLTPINATGNAYKIRIDVGDNYVHASRQATTIDANTLMLQVINTLESPLMHLESDRPITGEVNTTSYISEARIITDKTEAELYNLVTSLAQNMIDNLSSVNPAREFDLEALIQITPITMQPAYDALPFVQSILSLRETIKQTYTNVIYDAPPVTISIIAKDNSLLQAKIDMRTDVRLHHELSDLLASCCPTPLTAKILWNDPAMDGTLLTNNLQFEAFQQICSQKRSTSVSGMTGWTEGAVWTTRLGIPTIIGGSGKLGLQHKSNEYVVLEELQEFSEILESFLLQQ